MRRVNSIVACGNAASRHGCRHVVADHRKSPSLFGFPTTTAPTWPGALRVTRNPDRPLPPRFDDEPPVRRPPNVPIAVRGTDRRPLPIPMATSPLWLELTLGSVRSVLTDQVAFLNCSVPGVVHATQWRISFSLSYSAPTQPDATGVVIRHLGEPLGLSPRERGFRRRLRRSSRPQRRQPLAPSRCRRQQRTLADLT